MINIAQLTSLTLKGPQVGFFSMKRSRESQANPASVSYQGSLSVLFPSILGVEKDTVRVVFCPKKKSQ